MLSDQDGEIDSRPQAWPRYVRVLAVAYVLSRFVGPVGFFLLGGVTAFAIARHGPGVEGAVVAAAALMCPAGCAIFRWWFRRWGQLRWPEVESEADVSDASLKP
ncbi:hypothetical protein BH10PLA2_BH10PLA2_11110 [soil metagenome]